MNVQEYQLGNVVHLTFQPSSSSSSSDEERRVEIESSRDSAVLTTEAAQSHNNTDNARGGDIVVNLSNFSGQLVIQSLSSGISMKPVMKLPPSRARDKNGEIMNEKPFSMALGDPKETIAAMSFSTPPTTPNNKKKQKLQSVNGGNNDGATNNHNSDTHQMGLLQKIFQTSLRVDKPSKPEENNASAVHNEFPNEVPSTPVSARSTGGEWREHYIPEDPENDNAEKGIELFRKIVRKVMACQWRVKSSSTKFMLNQQHSHKSGRWGNLLMLATARGRGTDRIREKRDAVREFDGHGNNTTNARGRESFPTQLHKMCAESNVTLEQLQKALGDHPEAVSIEDARGRLPLHILGDNDYLVATKPGRQTASAFCVILMRAYPLSLTTRDNHRRMPFVAMIEDWVQYVYDQYRRKQANTVETNNVMERIALIKTKTELHKKRRKRKRSLARYKARNAHTDHSDSSRDESVRFDMQNKREEIHAFSETSHPDEVDLWDEVLWCFEMLSVAMDELAGKNGGLFKARRKSLMHHSVKDTTSRTKLATHLCEQIPALIKTILLVDEDAPQTRKRLLKMPIFRRCLLCEESVGPWLLNMLRSRSPVATTRAVDYLELVSGVDVADYIGAYRTPLPSDQETFKSMRTRVFDEINDLEGLVASLEVLENEEAERAAATAVVMNIFDKNLRRPFVLGLVLIDFVLHITLMLAFKRDVSYQGEDREDAIGSVPTQVVIFIASHYFIRKWCEALSLLKLSPQVFKSYFSNIWTFFDFVSIILVLVAVSWNDKNPDVYRQGLNAFVLGLLWIKVLGFLKVVNKEMSTFILSLIQILRDLRHFMIVMAVVIFMFGDMMHIALSTKDDGRYCTENEGDLSGPEEDFCSLQNMDSYLRVYSLLLGDFELDDYKENNGIVVLFVIFTMMGVIILLNVLIAVVSNSYERAKVRSISLFGRARVTFVAQNEALESFLRPGSDPTAGLEFVNSKRKRVWIIGTRLFRVLVLIAIIVTAMSAEVYLAARAYELVLNASLEIVTMVTIFSLTMILTMALVIVVNFALEGVFRNRVSGRAGMIMAKFHEGVRYCARRMGRSLFGLSDAIARGDHNEEQENWETRLEYIERVFEKSLVEVKSDLHQDIIGFEKRLYENNFSIGSEQGAGAAKAVPPKRR
uniref:Ion transport domain-containing protein n=1 Tax=Amphora coffeiformis TaxID=265554 RepID=A0A7S3L3W8_9STRA